MAGIMSYFNREKTKPHLQLLLQVSNLARLQNYIKRQIRFFKAVINYYCNANFLWAEFYFENEI